MQKEEVAAEDKAAGFKFGLESAMQFDYADFKVFETIKEELDRSRFQSCDDFQDLVDISLEKHRRDFDEIFWEPEHEHEQNFIDREAYLEGYINGALEVWEEVSKHL